MMTIKNLTYFILKNKRQSNCLVFIRSIYLNTPGYTKRQWIKAENAIDPINDVRTFTVMSYNILAQKHLHSHQDLYVENNPKYLEWPNRLTLICNEIENISPEILCLQEVEIDRLNEFKYELKGLNFSEPLYKKRSGHQTDGCAIFFNRNKFRLIEEYPIDYFRPGVRTLNRCNVAMAAKFSLNLSATETEFLISTTHLLFNPRRTDIRLAQLQVLLAELHRVAHVKGKPIPIILTGDFNVQQTSKPYRLICGQKINVDRVFRQANFPVETPAKLLPNELGITDDCRHSDIIHKNVSKITSTKKFRLPFNTGYLSHNLNFSSTMTNIGLDRASSYHHTWITVDYIFFSEGSSLNNLKLLANYQLPTINECKQCGPIPNEFNGSDHYSVAAKFTLT